MTDRPVKPDCLVAFSSECLGAIQRIRGALTDALSSVGADARDSGDIAKRLGIHKILAWRLAKIVTTTDAATPMRQMPGAPGVRILHKAFKKAGVPEDRVEAFGRSVSAYRQMVKRHAGDDDMLEVMLASRLDDPAFAGEAVRMRKEAFRGAAAVWGAYARMQLAMSVVSPARGHDDLIDLATLGGLIDFRRLREAVFCPVHFGSTDSDDGTEIEAGGAARPRSSLVRQFCSTPPPELEEVEEADRTILMVKPGPVGETARMTWMWDRIAPAAVSRYRDEENELGQHSITVHTPVELV